jgi:hypothetical protein
VTVDAIREVQPPFNFFEVVQTVLLPLCKVYGVTSVTADNYGGELARDPVRRAGISFKLAEKHKSELYRDPFLGMLNACKIDLPHHDRAVNQICSLECSTQRSGREQITHPTHGHDDVANAIAGAVDLAYSHSGYTLAPFSPDFVDLDRRPAEQQQPEPPRCNPFQGEWWKLQPRSQQSSPSADDNLRPKLN